MLETLFGHLEARLQVEDGLAVLDGHDASGGERAAVADAVDLVEDRHVGIAGPQEVGVERVDGAPGLHGAGRRHERLAGHLAAEHPLALLVGREPSEDVDLDRLEVEQLHERVDGVLRHGAHPRVRRRRVRSRPMPAQTFPDGFRWGTATAAHQIEGGNVNNDWWRWEHTPGSGCKESSGDCCDSWHRWPEDVALLKELGFTDYRFSLEWSRIEPADGEFSTVALDHYASALRGLARGRHRPGGDLPPLHHPAVARRPGRLDQRRDARPLRGATASGRRRRLDGLMARACTINEPSMVSTLGHLAGLFPPGGAGP